MLTIHSFTNLSISLCLAVVGLLKPNAYSMHNYHLKILTYILQGPTHLLGECSS